MEKNKENQGNVQSNVKIEWDLTKIYSNIDKLKKDIEKELYIIVVIISSITTIYFNPLKVIHIVIHIFKLIVKSCKF